MDSMYLIIVFCLLLLPFLVLSLVLFLKLSGRKKQDKLALQGLIEQVAVSAPEHKKAIAEFLTNQAGLDEGDALDETVENIYSARKSVLQKIITAFITRDKKYIESLNVDLNPLVNAYQSLELNNQSMTEMVTETVDVSEDTSALEATVEKLKKENKNLKVELHTTLATLNAIFTEYASIFGDVKDKKDLSVDEILSAMESFSEGDIEKATEGDIPATELIADEEHEEIPPGEPELFTEIASDTESDSAPMTETAAEAEEEPSWDEAFAEADQGTEEVKAEPEAEPKAEEEPSWDEAFAETDQDTEEVKAEPEAEPKAEEEPSWDEAFAETDQTSAESNGDTEADSETAEQEEDPNEWGDEGDDEDLGEIDEMEEIEPEWGNAMEDELDDEPESKK